MNKLLTSIIITGILFTVTGCKSQIVTFTTTLKKENATKEGIYLDEYIVHLSKDSVLLLDGKEIEVTGKYFVVKGLAGTEEKIIQGRSGNRKHIKSPEIRILN